MTTIISQDLLDDPFQMTRPTLQCRPVHSVPVVITYSLPVEFSLWDCQCTVWWANWNGFHPFSLIFLFHLTHRVYTSNFLPFCRFVITNKKICDFPPIFKTISWRSADIGESYILVWRNKKSYQHFPLWCKF